MKNFQTRTLPLVICILVGMVLSWVSFYSFWFGVWIFHTVPAARLCDAAGSVVLFPARKLFQLLGGDQSMVFFDPISFSGTNGLMVGLVFYGVFRLIWGRREAGREVEEREREVAGRL